MSARVTRYRLGGEQIVINSPKKVSDRDKKYVQVAKVTENTHVTGDVTFQIEKKDGTIVSADKSNLVLNISRNYLARMLRGEILSGFKVSKMHVGTQGTDPLDSRIPLPVDRAAVALNHKEAEYSVISAESDPTQVGLCSFEFYIPFEELNGMDLSEYLLEVTMNDDGSTFPFSIVHKSAIPKDSSIAIRVFWRIRF